MPLSSSGEVVSSWAPVQVRYPVINETKYVCGGIVVNAKSDAY